MTTARQTSSRPPRQGAKYVVAKVSDVPEGGRVIAEIAGRSIGVFRLHGEFYALLNRCPHHGGPLCKGEMLALIESDAPGSFRFDKSITMLACPWHGWEFDIRTGQSWWDPQRTKAKAYPAAIEHGEAIVDHLAGGPGAGRSPGPYMVETLPISVENDYVVVTMPPQAAAPEGGAG